MRILAKIKANSSSEHKSDIKYLTLEEFEKLFYIKHGKRVYCTQPDAISWSKNGRIGSHWQVSHDMYVLLDKEGEDPYKYYKPTSNASQLSKGSWHGTIKGPSSGKCGSGCSC